MAALNKHRHEAILSRLEDEHRVSVTDLATSLGVTGETIRRDLKVLEDEGLLRRLHGGASLRTRVQDRPLQERNRLNMAEKGIIAGLARRIITNRSSIFLDTGTTTLSLARRLSGFRDLQIYTNSLDIARAAAEYSGTIIYVTPGRLRKNDNALVGYDTVKYVEGFNFDIAFMGIAGVHPEQGLTDYEEDEARLRQSLICHARSRIVLADHSKFDKTASIRSLGFADIDSLISDRKPPRDLTAAMEGVGVEVVHT
jgi:DeoR family glycerol-3-phosphate regulon repressor